MDEQAAIGFEHEQAGGQRQVRVETPGVVDGTLGYYETHPKSLTLSDECRVRGWRTRPTRRRLLGDVGEGLLDRGQACIE
ncbi:hypothetical protein GCM10022381_36030 [Leifsonia kafniensis]|uniref:Uncharacterized protein n=1 Tax=Leifsonia kafniensis TaxID=475957 RepID=A0ABP7L1G4_9MICO